jgi:hypothetical protein
MNAPSASRPEPRTSPEKEPAQENRAARPDELLARADQAARRIAAQQAERQASSEYAARMELEAQPQTEAGPQAGTRDDVELELLRRSSSSCILERFNDKKPDEMKQSFPNRGTQREPVALMR